MFISYTLWMLQIWIAHKWTPAKVHLKWNGKSTFPCINLHTNKSPIENLLNPLNWMWILLRYARAWTHFIALSEQLRFEAPTLLLCSSTSAATNRLPTCTPADGTAMPHTEFAHKSSICFNWTHARVMAVISINGLLYILHNVFCLGSFQVCICWNPVVLNLHKFCITQQSHCLQHEHIVVAP